MRVPTLAALVTGLSVTVIACQGGGGEARIPVDSTEYYRTQVQNLATISSEKDSLLRDLTETTKLITDVSMELATIQGPSPTNAPVVGSEGMTTDERAEVLTKVRQLTTRVRRSEARLADTRRRLDSLATTADSLAGTLAVYAATITDLEGLIENQKTTIQTLTDQVSSLMAQNVRLAQEKAVLEDTVSAITERENEVYWVVGTKNDLKTRGIITETGGTRFLLFTRTGETLLPSNVLDPEQFTLADLRTLTEIPLPKDNKDYRIVSQHDLAYAEADQMKKDNKFRGSALRILNPQAFWQPSKYLIIVEN